MRIRLLIISILTLCCSALTDAGDIVRTKSSSAQEILQEYLSANKISPVSQELVLPYRANLAFPTQTRSVSSQRSTSQNSKHRSTFFIAGKKTDAGSIKGFRREIEIIPAGLGETYRFFIFLHKLII